jgi:hypothetical protein
VDESTNPRNGHRAGDRLVGGSPRLELVRVGRGAIFVVGALEDPDDFMQEVASSMRDAIRVRIQGLGHINAFLASETVLPHVTEFLSKHSA